MHAQYDGARDDARFGRLHARDDSLDNEEAISLREIHAERNDEAISLREIHAERRRVRKGVPHDARHGAHRDEAQRHSHAAGDTGGIGCHIWLLGCCLSAEG